VVDITDRDLTESPAPRNIFQRINRVRRLIGYVQKDARIDGKYTAVTHDQVTAMIRQHLIDEGIHIVTTLRDAQHFERSENEKQYRTHYVFDVSFVNEDDPADAFSVSVPAWGVDSGDKGAGKAHSLAVKTAILKQFNLETGDNEESRFGEPIDDDVMVKGIELINSACDMDDLKTVFAAQYKLAGKDQQAQKAFIRAKNNRKKILDGGDK
jgi:hypothetical protein